MVVDNREAAAGPLPELGQALLDAKFSVPEARPEAVSRRSLIEAARASGRRVVGVTAPAGYGKSTLLAQWARIEDRPVAFVSLDRFDDDPAALLAVLASAYGRVTSDTAPVPDMGGRGLSVLGRAAPRLASAVNASPSPFVLMLDDLHEVRSAACHDALGVVISGIPHGSQLVVASRSEQPHLPRLRASGDVHEFGAGDLTLDVEGAQQVFAAARVDLDSDAATAVTTRTEGWPGGLYLAALIAKERPGEFLSITGDDPYVADYLYREALMQLPDDVQRFLRGTAVLDQLSGPLCDAVLESSDAHATLRHLEATNLFLVRLDHRREWYRYHALFREFLLGELRRSEPDRVIANLHVRAADWYERNGSPAFALVHLFNTEERDRCVRLVSELLLDTYQAGQITTAQRWLATLGDSSIKEYPPLGVLAAWITALSGQATEAQRWASIVAAASFDGTPIDGTASFESARAMLRAMMFADGPEQLMTDARLAVAHEPAWSPWRDTALTLLGEALLIAGDPEQAGAAFTEGSRVAADLANAGTLVVAQSELAVMTMERGQWADAAQHVDRALANIDEHGLHDYALALLAFASAARLAWHRGDRQEAGRQLARAMRSRQSCTFVIPFIAVRLRLQLAKVHLAMADASSAHHLLSEIDDLLRQRPSLGALVEEVSEFRRSLTSGSPRESGGGPPLTPAELRVLPYLQTHLKIAEIAGRLFVSHNTIRTQVTSIYRKLGVSSRDDAVQRATAIGLLG